MVDFENSRLTKQYRTPKLTHIGFRQTTKWVRRSFRGSPNWKSKLLGTSIPKSYVPLNLAIDILGLYFGAQGNEVGVAANVDGVLGT